MALKPYEQVAFDVIGRWHSRRITSPPRDGRQPTREGIPTARGGDRWQVSAIQAALRSQAATELRAAAPKCLKAARKRAPKKGGRRGVRIRRRSSRTARA